MSKFNLDTFLKQAEKEKVTCPYCKNSQLKETLEAFMQKKADGETYVSVHKLFHQCLIPQLNAPKSYQSLSNHIKCCMNRDLRTGKPLNG